jgi:hypothetical protein
MPEKQAACVEAFVAILDDLFGDDPVAQWSATFHVESVSNWVWGDYSDEDDFVFEAGERLYWLHFGVSD